MAGAAWDVIVVGAGPAGLTAAIGAAERGLRTLLAEKNRRPGVKILASGGTRCNLTHAASRAEIIEAFGAHGRFLHSALAALDPQGLIDWFQAMGVPTKIEPGGKVFPASDRAADVLDALLDRLGRSRSVLRPDEPIRQVQRAENGFHVVTSRDELWTRNLVLATGGQSYPGCGTTGDGYAMAASLGHTIVPPRPALAPLVSPASWVLALQGLTLPDVVVQVVPLAPRRSPDNAEQAAGKPFAKRRGSLLFTHFGLSGPAAMDVSQAVSALAAPRRVALQCDFLPDEKAAALDERLREECVRAGARQMAGLLAASVPARLAATLLDQAGVRPDQRAAELSKTQRMRIVQLLKGLLIPVTGTLGFEKAEVTAGGVALDEIDSRTMQSKRVPGLYVIGELLDLDGPIGGYNFQAAFSTGWLAGGMVRGEG